MTTDSNRTTKALPSIEQPASVDRPQVLVVDGDSATRRHSTLVLRQAGYDVESFDVAEALVSAPGLAKASCVVVDLHLPEGKVLSCNERLPQWKAQYRWCFCHVIMTYGWRSRS